MESVVNVKKINNKAIMPTRGSEEAAGFDLYACFDNTVTIPPKNLSKITTGIALEIPRGFVGLIYARSGLSTKKGLRPANAVGVIDSDYRGEIIVPLYNDNPEPQTINNGERIAQIIFHQIPLVRLAEVNELNDTKRGVGGFGSTGTL